MMSLGAIKKTLLPLFHHRFKSYLAEFVTLLGPQRKIDSPKIGTKLIKAHSYMHLARQIARDGSPLNSCGSYCESHLKTFVKRPGRMTNKTQKDFTKQTLNRFSDYQAFDHLVREFNLVTDHDGDTATRPLTVDEGLKIGATKFQFLRVQGQQWVTSYSGDSKNGLLHPFYELDQAAIAALVEHMRLLDNNVNVVNCHYELTTSSKVTTREKDIFRCNPKYRGSPWFDWLHAEYEIGRGETTRTSIIGARLYLWMSCRKRGSYTY